MSNVNGITNYGFLFENSNNFCSGNNISNLTSSLLGGGSNGLLGDYAMIKSGAYEKLVTAYYKSQDASSNDDKSTASESSTVSKVDASSSTYMTVKNEADSLSAAASKLSDSSLYGDSEEDKKKLTKAVNDYVSSYNGTLNAASETKSTDVMSKTLNIIKKTASNEKMLKDIGITVGEDNKLTVNEEKLASADVSKISSLFKGSGSYGAMVETKAEQISKQANSLAYTTCDGTSYSQNGSYSMLGSTNGIVDKLF